MAAHLPWELWGKRPGEQKHFCKGRGKYHPHYPRNKILLETGSADSFGLFLFFDFRSFSVLFRLYGSISKTDGKAEIYILLSAEGWCTGPYLLVGPAINLPAGDLNPVSLIGRAV